MGGSQKELEGRADQEEETQRCGDSGCVQKIKYCSMPEMSSEELK